MIRIKKKNRDILVLSILTLITVLTWIAFDVYKALTKTTIPKVLEEQMRPLEPRIDRAKIEKLKERLSISEEELEKIAISKIEEATPAAEMPESTESATPSGGL